MQTLLCRHCNVVISAPWCAPTRGRVLLSRYSRGTLAVLSRGVPVQVCLCRRACAGVPCRHSCAGMRAGIRARECLQALLCRNVCRHSCRGMLGGHSCEGTAKAQAQRARAFPGGKCPKLRARSKSTQTQEQHISSKNRCALACVDKTTGAATGWPAGPLYLFCACALRSAHSWPALGWTGLPYRDF